MPIHCKRRRQRRALVAGMGSEESRERSLRGSRQLDQRALPTQGWRRPVPEPTRPSGDGGRGWGGAGEHTRPTTAKVATNTSVRKAIEDCDIVGPLVLPQSGSG